MFHHNYVFILCGLQVSAISGLSHRLNQFKLSWPNCQFLAKLIKYTNIIDELTFYNMQSKQDTTLCLVFNQDLH